jgi:hypothetical protein
MRIRTILLAATIAALPALAMAQTAAPSATAPPAAAAPAATPDKPHHERGERHKHHAAQKAAYEKLNAGDKAKFDDLTKQMKQIHQQRMQILGIGKS